MLISSTKNPRIKSVLELGKARERQSRLQFALEGAREIERAITCGYRPQELYWCAALLSPLSQSILANCNGEVARYEVTEAVYAKLAVREGSDGLIAVLQQKSHDLDCLPDRPMALILAVQGVEKPGNLGALLRSADGAGVDAVLLVDQQLDLYNPLVLRTSVGTAFSLPVVSINSDTLQNLARKKGWRIVAAALSPRSKAYTDADLSMPSVILLGTEAVGLSDSWLRNADELVKIPMAGVADSLNVSAAGAILLYEARRQKLASVNCTR